MSISPKWQRMWMESQHCSRSIVRVPIPFQQAKRVMEDLRTQCCSPVKAVQLEALKCWRMWIHSLEPEDWKLKTVCFAAVKPLIPNKFQPLRKDFDIFRLKLSLTWALLVKVQNIIHLEGPQYILEVFLQNCLTWLPSAENESDTYIFSVVIQLLLHLFKKDEILSGIDNDEFPPLKVDLLRSKKTFHDFAENFITVFVHWRKVQEKAVILKLWNNFLEHCELSCMHIPILVWHKIFKQAGQIFSEKGEPVKERLAFLHGCATILKSSLSSSKFINCSNLFTTPCEALLKSLIELCCAAVPEDCGDAEMFYHAKEICQVLSVQSVALDGYILCIDLLDILDEILPCDLHWGVWCGLVYCFKILLQNIDQRDFTKEQRKFYRKLRGVAVNFDLDRNNIHKDCINEVEEHIRVLNIGCLCASHHFENLKDSTREDDLVDLKDTDSYSQPSESPPVTKIAPEEVYKQIAQCEPTRFYGKFSDIILRKRFPPRSVVYLNFDLNEDILKKVGITFLKSSPNCSFTFRCIELQRFATEEAFRVPKSRSLLLRPALEAVQEMKSNVTSVGSKIPSPVPECVLFEETGEEEEDEGDNEMISTPLTGRKRRGEEERERESERQTRRKRKSFEDLVQEILKKNKQRKTEKNSKRKNPVSRKGKRNKKKVQNTEEESEPKQASEPENPGRRLRNSKKEKESKKTDERLENYFKVLSKERKRKRKKENKRHTKKRESGCCKWDQEEGEKKGEVGWRKTSLKTLMSQESQGKLRTGKNKVATCPLAKLSPYKEVVHDHEYVKIDSRSLQKSVLFTPRNRKIEKSEAEDEKLSKPELNRTEVKECEEIEAVGSETPQQTKTEPIWGTENSNLQDDLETLQADEAVKDGDNKLNPKPEEENPSDEVKVTEETPVRVGIKRMRTCDDHEPRKRIKLEPEEQQEKKFLSERTEKENLEERQSPRKKSTCSALNTMSRALRMIALVPESAKGGQIQREALPRKEALKGKKGPNIDRSSRASKMLALLSQNVVKVEDVSDMKEENVSDMKEENVSDMKEEDVGRRGGPAATPKAKPQASCLKSSKSIKKRRSVTFDDAKNETVLYQKDTPPSQILKEKEKARRSKLAEITVKCP